MDCNYLGTDRWLSDLQWSGSGAYYMAKRDVWQLDGKVVGTAIQVENLTQVIVQGAGHLVPMNQPKTASAMLETFMSRRSFFAVPQAASDDTVEASTSYETIFA